MTRQPNADELAENLSFDTARANEAAFFAYTAPWSALDETVKNRLGTKNLTASLSKELMLLIRLKHVEDLPHAVLPC